MGKQEGDVEASDQVHSLTRDNGDYWCRRCEGGPWTSTMAASREPCRERELTKEA